MPSKSKKQQDFMAAVANNPKFAEKTGVPQSVGKDYEKADKMKGMKKYQQGGMSMKDVAMSKMGKQGDNARLDDSMGARNGPAMQGMQARRNESEGMEKAMGKRKFAGDKAMPRMNNGGKVRGAGIAKKGVKPCKMR
tara:strand:+ start:1114 stop:1524 length:411 start_codon:yes stop_codon:yes gene_type:complete